MMKFMPGQRIRGKQNHEDLGTVEWHSGQIVRTSTGLHVFARDVEAVDETLDESPIRLGDLCSAEGDPITDTAVLIGDHLQLVWKSRPTRAHQLSEVRVELRRLDGSYVATVAIGNVTPGHLMLAMPYLEERYGEPPGDWSVSEGTIEELYLQGGDDHDPART